MCSSSAPWPGWFSSRYRAGRRGALVGLGQLGGGERGSVEDVALAHLDPGEPVAVEDLDQDRRAGHDHARASGLDSGGDALVERQGDEPLRLRPRSRRGEVVTVDSLGVVPFQSQVERGD